MSIFSKNSPPPGHSVKVARLTDTERSELLRIEMVIRTHLASYAEVGKALAAVRDKQLFRETHESFEAYISDKWKMSPQHANRLIAAAGVATNLEPAGSIPANEYQARPLARLEPADQLHAWQDANELAGDEVLTVAHVEEAVGRRSPKKKRKLAKPVSIKVPGASVRITPNKAFVSVEAALLAALDKIRSRQAA